VSCGSCTYFHVLCYVTLSSAVNLVAARTHCDVVTAGSLGQKAAALWPQDAVVSTPYCDSQTLRAAVKEGRGKDSSVGLFIGMRASFLADSCIGSFIHYCRILTSSAWLECRFFTSAGCPLDMFVHLFLLLGFFVSRSVTWSVYFVS
jgi:hypothetical protein